MAVSRSTVRVVRVIVNRTIFWSGSCTNPWLEQLIGCIQAGLLQEPLLRLPALSATFSSVMKLSLSFFWESSDSKVAIRDSCFCTCASNFWISAWATASVSSKASFFSFRHCNVSSKHLHFLSLILKFWIIQNAFHDVNFFSLHHLLFGFPHISISSALPFSYSTLRCTKANRGCDQTPHSHTSSGSGSSCGKKNGGWSICSRAQLRDLQNSR